MQIKINKDTSRESIQESAITTWINSNKTGTLEIVTGLGKSRIGVVLGAGQLKKELIQSCLIVVPTTNLISQWEDEIIRWGYSLDGITIKCLQSAYKTEQEYDLLIIDEIHTTLGPQYSKIFTNIKYKQILGLSATVDKDNSIIAQYCPVIFTCTIKEALEAKAYNEYKVYNVEVPMTRRERAIYNTFDRQFKLAKFELTTLKKNVSGLEKSAIFDLAKEYSNYKIDKTMSPSFIEIIRWSKIFWSNMTMRRYNLYKMESKLIAAKDIIMLQPNKKWIVFTMSITAATKLSEMVPNSKVYHSKQKPDEREVILQEFRDNKFNILIAVQALDAGTNVPDISNGLCVSGTSSEIAAIQRLGQVGLYSFNSVKPKFIQNTAIPSEAYFVVRTCREHPLCRGVAFNLIN